MGPYDCQIISTYISQASSDPLQAENAVSVSDDTVIVIETQFGGAFPAVTAIVGAAIIDASRCTHLFDVRTTFVVRSGHDRRSFPVPEDAFTDRADHLCEIKAYLSVRINTDFPPDASWATRSFLLTV